MKVYLVDSHIFRGRDPSVERDILQAAGHEFIAATCKNEEEVIAQCADADAILDVYTYLGEKAMAALKNCKVLIRYGIGYDTFDVEAATKQGIMVCNIPHYCIPEVAMHTTALVLACARNLLAYTMNMRQGLYNTGPVSKMRRPSAQTVGMIGFGNIARTCAGQLREVGYNLIACDPYLEDSVFAQAGADRVERDELFAKADIISVHTPYSQDTHHLINRESIARMKDGVILVNTARGPLICEADLVEALQSGKVAAAGLDVFETEPFNPQEHPFYGMDNVILTPHAAFNTAESSVELFRQVAECAVSVLGGEVPYNVVNREDLAITK